MILYKLPSYLCGGRGVSLLHCPLVEQDFVRDEDEGRGSKRSLSSVMNTMQQQVTPHPSI